ANVSYGQELAYLHCPSQFPEYGIGDPDEILVLDDESMKWSKFPLYKTADGSADEFLEEILDDETVAEVRDIINGILTLIISGATSTEYRLVTLFDRLWILDRVTGRLRSGTTHPSNCSPITKSQVEELFQEGIDRRDEIIKGNEAKRLF
ncbi:MAG: hypothetical protein AAEJ46_10295, partial [Planctomycetota bacterium]